MRFDFSALWCTSENWIVCMFGELSILPASINISVPVFSRMLLHFRYLGLHVFCTIHIRVRCNITDQENAHQLRSLVPPGDEFPQGTLPLYVAQLCQHVCWRIVESSCHGLFLVGFHREKSTFSVPCRWVVGRLLMFTSTMSSKPRSFPTM